MDLLNKLKLQRGMSWFDHRPLRERALMVAAVLVVLYFFVDLLIVGASTARTKVLKRRIEAQATEVATVRKDIAELSKLVGQKPMTQELAQLEGMKRTVAEADELLTQLDNAPRAGDVVKALLGAATGLELVSLKTLPVTLALDARPAPAAAVKPPAVPADAKAPVPDAKAAAVKPQVPVRPPRAIYRHGIEVTVKGNYLALLPYLQKLQNYPGRLYWSEMSVDVQSHPDAVLKMIIYTMSGQADPRLG